MSRLVKATKLPAKRFVAALKRVSLAGDASVHWRTTVRGPGVCELRAGARIGPDVTIDLHGGTLVLREGASIPRQAILRVGGSIDIGESSTIMHYSVLYGEGGVTIGKRVLIANHCLITSTEHLHEGRDRIIEQGMHSAPIVIGDDAWIGAYTLIDPGVRVGTGAIIGAHSYVRSDVPDYAVVGGVPAKVLKMRVG